MDKTITLTFDELVQHGKDSGGNVVNGMPWSFSVFGYPVTNENDNLYLITLPLRRLMMAKGDLLEMTPSGLAVRPDLSNPVAWMLVSVQDLKSVSAALLDAVTRGHPVDTGLLSKALHTLESGQHTSTVVPADFTRSS